MVFVNKLDRERASFDATLAQLRDRLGAGIAPLELPIGEEAGFRGIADLLTDTAHIYDGGVASHRGDPRRAWRRSSTRCTTTWSRASSWPTTTCSSATSTATSPASTSSSTRCTTASPPPPCSPSSCGSATREIGIDRLADLSGRDRPVPPRPAGTDHGRQRRPRGAIDVAADPDRRSAGLRVQDHRRPLRRAGQSCSGSLSGTVRPDDHLVNSRTGADERLHGLFTVRGKEQEPASELVAGDIGAVSKLAGTATGDTLAPRGKPVVVPPIDQPEPTLAVAVVPRTQADEDKLGPAPAPPGRRGPRPAGRAHRRDPPDAAARHRRDPPADHAREAHPQVRGQRRDRAAARRLPRDDHRRGQGRRGSAQEADRRPRPVRRVRHRPRAPRPRGRLRVRQTRSSAAPSAAASSPPCRRGSRRR